jgi:hypothetical protein
MRYAVSAYAAAGVLYGGYLLRLLLERRNLMERRDGRSR